MMMVVMMTISDRKALCYVYREMDLTKRNPLYVYACLQMYNRYSNMHIVGE